MRGYSYWVSCCVLCACFGWGCQATEVVEDDGGVPPDARLNEDAQLPPPTGPLGLNDVSILFPLPTRVSSPHTLRLSSPGNGGPLLSRADFDRIPVFAEDPQPELEYEDFHVVGARVDPCFPDLAALTNDPASCRRQIRLVAQPLVDGALAEPSTVAQDSAIHLLFDLDVASFDALVAVLVALREDRPSDPTEVLDVHPVLRSEGEGGSVGTALRALILEHAGPATLSKFTFMRGDENFFWDFGGVKVEGESRTPIAIHGIEATEEADPYTQFIGFDFGPVTVHPPTDHSRSMEVLFGERSSDVVGGEGFSFTGTLEEQRAAHEAAQRIENPRERHPENVDCASCHLAGPLRARFEETGGAGSDRFRFRSGFDLTLTTPAEFVGQPNRVRAFGYFHSSPSLSQRAVNESAAVAEALNAMLAQ